MSGIDSICRTCMTFIDENSEEIFPCNIFEIESLAEKLMMCSNIEIQPFDGYPSNVCNTCCTNILDFCDFQEMCRESLQKFKKMLEIETNTHFESYSVDGVASADYNARNISPVLESESDLKFNELLICPVDSIPNNDAVEKLSDDNLQYETKVENNECDIISSREMPTASITNKIKGDSTYQALFKNNVLNQDSAVKSPLKSLRVYTAKKKGSIIKFNNMSVMAPWNDSIQDEELEGREEDSESEYENLDVKFEIVEDPVLNKSFKSSLNITTVSEENMNADPEENNLVVSCKEDEFSFKADSEDVWGNEAVTTEEEYLEDYLILDEEIISDSVSVRTMADSITRSRYKFFCDACPRMFVKQHNYNAHLRKHKGLPPYPCPIENCSKAFHQMKELQRHTNNHNGIPNEIYTCHIGNCAVKYSTKNGLTMHLRRQHNHGPAILQNEFVCETCGNVYAAAHKLRVHQYLHVDQTLWPFKCDYMGCLKPFRSKANYKIHMNRHYGIKPYSCSFCDKRFVSKTNLKAHTRYHTFLKKFTCKICLKTFYTPKEVKNHVQKIHENKPQTKYPCSYCNKELSTQLIRQVHEMSHRNEKPYVCEFCGRSFIHTTRLRQHRRSHLPNEQKLRNKNLKKYTCNICNSSSPTPSSLRNHMIKHSKEKPYKCDACGVKFRYIYNLKRHHKKSQCGLSRNFNDSDDVADKKKYQESLTNNVIEKKEKKEEFIDQLGIIIVDDNIGANDVYLDTL